MDAEKLEKLMQDAWTVAIRNARRPVSTIVLPDRLAVELATTAMESFMAAHRELPARSEIIAFVVKSTKTLALQAVADERQRTGDHNLYRAEQVSATMPSNLDLAKLVQHDKDEWSALEMRLRPFTMHLLGQARVHDHESDFDDLFSASMAALVRPRASDGKAPVDLMVIYEDLPSMYSAIVKRKAVDWVRRKTALKNQPNVQESVDAMAEDPEHPVVVPDPASVRHGDDSFETLTFDAIYNACRDCLSGGQWDLLTQMFVEGSSSRAELIRDPDLLDSLGIDSGSSMSTRRRRLDECIVDGLNALKDCLNEKF